MGLAWGRRGAGVGPAWGWRGAGVGLTRGAGAVLFPGGCCGSSPLLRAEDLLVRLCELPPEKLCEHHANAPQLRDEEPVQRHPAQMREAGECCGAGVELGPSSSCKGAAAKLSGGGSTHVDFFQAPARPIIPLISDTTDDISISAFPVLAGVASCREVNAHAQTTWVVQIPYITRWRKSARAFASTTSANPRQCE